MKKLIFGLLICASVGVSRATLFSWTVSWDDADTPTSIALYYVASADSTPTEGQRPLEEFSSADLAGETSVEYLTTVTDVPTSGFFYLVVNGLGADPQFSGYNQNGTADGYVAYSDVTSFLYDRSVQGIDPSLPTLAYNFGTVQAIPEPATAMLFLGGVAMLAFRRRHR